MIVAWGIRHIEYKCRLWIRSGRHVEEKWRFSLSYSKPELSYARLRHSLAPQIFFSPVKPLIVLGPLSPLSKCLKLLFLYNRFHQGQHGKFTVSFC